MATRRKRHPYYTKRGLYPGKRSRIKMPPRVFRPYIVRSELLKREAIKQDPWWFVEHKRGVRRVDMGEDPLEARAVSKLSVKGTLPERIVYKWLVSKMRLSPTADFDFQSSLFGGRLELGGIVADFLFYYPPMVLQVQGSTHKTMLRKMKDNEQWSILKSLGYEVYFLDEELIYNQQLFEDTMTRIFALGGRTSRVYAHPVGSPISIWGDVENIYTDAETTFTDISQADRIENYVNELYGIVETRWQEVTEYIHYG